MSAAKRSMKAMWLACRLAEGVIIPSYCYPWAVEGHLIDAMDELTVPGQPDNKYVPPSQHWESPLPTTCSCYLG